MTQGCAACGKDDILVTDHCHASGFVRGMICRSCNLLLGRFNDSAGDLRARADQLTSLAAYLDRGVTNVIYARPRPQSDDFPVHILNLFPRGQAWLAREIGTSASTVACWKMRNHIPYWWRDRIIELAARERINIAPYHGEQHGNFTEVSELPQQRDQA